MATPGHTPRSFDMLGLATGDYSVSNMGYIGMCSTKGCGFLSRFALKQVLDFDNFGLKGGQGVVTLFLDHVCIIVRNYL